ncbi:helix-turn-helix transcriptional regulator [Mycolicibacterium brisbanense]|uniref:DNA-binding protein n=1 Tax=Mycolicibacterium brisbanense TaxID=146020 RepID=A0A100W1B4_9MYCO|nr:helix-turn-helix transcriptional regulator [Mycolicibacterium brisbanense]MCV7159999.1 helix-turn-helix domain-containing protein [Mycolicibacterium brisbanense]GAS89821.1 DNA-binding protein [Mycolicibacterium brisbanense]
MDKRELGAFLRSKRERIRPADVGLPVGQRRRTPGLRRDEVAHLAFISTDYYTRLEQARAPHPSADVLSGLVRALRLSDAERAYLYLLAGVELERPPGPPREVRVSILDLIQRLPQAAAIVLSATYEVLAWNDLACALMEDFSALSRRDRNLVRRAFLGPHPPDGRRLYGVSDADEFSHTAALHLRATAARYPDDPETNALIAELRSGSAEFAGLWNAHDIVSRPTLCKTFAHPVVGPVAVNCDSLDIADRDQRVVIYTPEPGSPSEEAMRLLAVLGTQRMDVPG